MDVERIEFGCEDDYVHLLVTAVPKLAIANIVGKLKGKRLIFQAKHIHRNSEKIESSKPHLLPDVNSKEK